MSNTIYREAAIEALWFEPSYTDPLNVLTEARDRIKALPSVQLDPCDVCAHKDDCGDMRIYCPAERRTDE